MEKALIELKGIHKSFGENEGRVDALRGVNLSINEGEFVAIMGKSGSGKSTLLNIVGGMMSMDKGTYCFESKLLNFKKQKALTAFRRNKVGIIVQYFALVDDMNVYQNVAVPLKFQGLSTKEQRERIMGALELLEISDKSKSYPWELSGGQQQRVAIARAIVKRPRILLADEPTGALDENTGEAVMKILKSMHREGQTIVMVTHDRRIAEYSDRIVFIKDGVVEREEEMS